MFQEALRTLISSEGGIQLNPFFFYGVRDFWISIGDFEFRV